MSKNPTIIDKLKTNKKGEKTLTFLSYCTTAVFLSKFTFQTDNQKATAGPVPALVVLPSITVATFLPKKNGNPKSSS
jgi:hypothetical protein